jgi:xylan 1,4-beta-xylosidase
MKILRIFLIVFVSFPLISWGQNQVVTIQIDSLAPSHPFPHFWEQMFGSGRASLSLRESYLNDLRKVKKITDFKYVRFHAIFHDELGVYDQSPTKEPIYNFAYVDQIYDGLLQAGVRPFIELGFMPRKMSQQPPVEHVFWYHPLVSPPADWNQWSDLVTHFARHLIERYGIDEVSHWYFETWNEPNIDFWAGTPKEKTYYQLYDTTARALKSISPRLRVGGPATAQAAWVDRFIQHCTDENIPVDFVTTHVYGNDLASDVFGTHEDINRNHMVCRAAKKVFDQVRVSSQPHLPLIFSEYNASYKNEVNVTDDVFMGPWLADTIRQCDGLTEMMSYWTFSDVFEEQGVVKKPFYGGYGLIAEGGIPKPAYNAFSLLHKLGEKRLDVDSNAALVTRKSDKTLVVAVWNLFLPEEKGMSKTVTVSFKNLKSHHSALVSRLDSTHGSVWQAYKTMGEPTNPTSAQIENLRGAAELPRPEKISMKKNTLTLELPPQGLALIEVR